MNSSNEVLLSKPEIYILISIMQNQVEFGRGVQKCIISQNLESVDNNEFPNFIDFTLNINIERLIEKKLIERSDDNHAPSYAITSSGKNWLFTNEHRLQELLFKKTKLTVFPSTKNI